MVYFISGNENKKKETEAIFKEFGLNHELKFICMDLQEIQGSPKEIIEAKCKEAIKQNNTLAREEFFIEDTSLYLDALHGFPGPYIKYFERIGLENIFKIVDKLGNSGAKAVSMVGYYKNGNINIVSGETVGTIVEYKNGHNFGFDPIFKPHGEKITFSEMKREDKYKISHRSLAVKKMIQIHIIK